MDNHNGINGNSVNNNQLMRLVNTLAKKQDRIIPIIGDDCFVGIVDNCNGRTELPLQKYIITTITDEYGLESTSFDDGYYSMSLLCDIFCAKKKTGRVGFDDTVRTVVEEGLKEKRIYLKPNVKAFLLSGHFDVIVTTHPFHILEHELKKAGCNYNVSVFIPKTVEEGHSVEAGLKTPVIYRIFGDCERANFVLTENDLLQFLHHLNSRGTESGNGASLLVNYIKKKYADENDNCLLMPIGCCNLPNWLFRFLWYPLSPQLLLTVDKDRCNGGVWCDDVRDRSFCSFLEEYNFRHLRLPGSKDPATDILSELSKAFKQNESSLQQCATNSLGVIWDDPSSEWDIFISYASEDRKDAQVIYDILTQEPGMKVWMDNRNISVGNDYWVAIQHGIEHSKRCLFVVTETYLKKAAGTTRIRNEYGLSEESGVKKELQIIYQFFLRSRKDCSSINSYSIPIIRRGTKVAYADSDGREHKDEELTGKLLEQLHEMEGYKGLRTDCLFANTQAEIFDENNIGEIMLSLKKQEL